MRLFRIVLLFILCVLRVTMNSVYWPQRNSPRPDKNFIPNVYLTTGHTHFANPSFVLFTILENKFVAKNMIVLRHLTLFV